MLENKVETARVQLICTSRHFPFTVMVQFSRFEYRTDSAGAVEQRNKQRQEVETTSYTQYVPDMKASKWKFILHLKTSEFSVN